MGDSKVAASACLLLLLLASGCASLRGSVQKAFRAEGTALLDFPEVVWEKYDCQRKKLPFFEIEKIEIVPREVGPGGEFNHRLVYAMCPSRPTAVIGGRLYTRILFKGDAIYGQTDEDYEIQPGRWRVDTFVELPDDADPGIYGYQIEFRGEALRFERSLTFVVHGS